MNWNWTFLIRTYTIAAEVEECMKSVKDAYTKMEDLNEVLVQKLILVDRAWKEENTEKSLLYQHRL